VKRSPLPLLALLLAAAPARAHVGMVVAKADFVHPAPPMVSYPDGGVAYRYVPEEADQSYRIEWVDGDLDPTGRFTFYYLDHGVSDGVSRDELTLVGTVARDVQGRDATSVWVSCSCDADAGVACPDAGARWCDNFVQWDTSGLPDGAWWLAAANDDPPFHVFNLSSAPVLVHHGQTKPPVLIVEKPDGIGDADKTADVALIAVGTGPMKLNLAWGDNDPARVLGPTTTIAKALPVTIGADGLFTYPWDTSQLPSGLKLFIRATLTDDAGTTYSDSRYGQGVFHRPQGGDGSQVFDLSMHSGDGPLNLTPKGCGCALGGRRATPPLALALLYLAIRRALRRGSRSACRS
jgi:hypothetical protein